MLKPTQMCLDDTMLSIADIAINPEPIAEEFPWELFEPVREAYEKARSAVESLGWHITLSDPARGLIEARDTSKLFRFVDDVAIRVRPGPSGGSLVDIRSKSRDGKGDLGINANRIRTFTTTLVH